MFEERLGRYIDGDLSRQERIELLAELASHPEKLPEAAALAALEQDLGDLARMSEAVPLPASLAAPLATPQPTPLAARLASLLTWLRQPPQLRTALGGLVGAAITAAVTLAVVQHNIDHTQPRLQVVAVHFHAAADAMDWTHDYRLKPGEKLNLDVQVDNKDPVHLRIQSREELAASLTHLRQGRRDLTHHLDQGKVRYATLHEPAKGDQLTVVNRGKAEIDLHLQAPTKDSFHAAVVQAAPGHKTVLALHKQN